MNSLIPARSDEELFLSTYNIEDYERPSVTADVAAFMIRSTDEGSYRRNPDNKLSLLLIRRGEHPFKNAWALPGGFLKANETIEECAFREITGETGIQPAALMPFAVFSECDRDPRGRVISHAFVSIISEDSVKATGGDDAIDAKWFDITFEQDKDGLYRLELANGRIVLSAALREKAHRFGKSEFEIADSKDLAFDHAKIIAAALTVLRNEARNFEIIFDFLPEKFTLTSLQRVQETIMNISVLPANFRRKVADYVIETDEYTSGAGHRPAKLFMRKEKNAECGGKRE